MRTLRAFGERSSVWRCGCDSGTRVVGCGQVLHLRMPVAVYMLPFAVLVSAQGVVAESVGVLLYNSVCACLVLPTCGV